MKVFQIEPFDGSDASYEACVALDNQAYPHYANTADEWKRHDTLRDPKRYYRRFVEREVETGSIVGFGTVANMDWGFHPRKFELEIVIDEAHRGRGAGKAMYQALLDDVADTNPISFDSFTASNIARGIRFLEDRGYKLATREYSSRLDLNTFDPTPFQSYVDRIEASELEIINHNQFRERFPDDWLRRLYDTNEELKQDIPYHEKPEPAPFELWGKQHLTHPNRVPETFLLAMDGNEVAGVTMLFKSGVTTETMFTGLTGVRRPYRRRGLAMALKILNLSYAKEHIRTDDGKAPSVMTENEENNPMFTINERLGFVRQPDWLAYKLVLVEDEQAEIEK